MRDTEVHPDAECRRGMRVSGGEGRGELEMGPGSRTEGEDGEAVSGCRIQPQLSPLFRHSAFLFCILHRGEIPNPAFISPLCVPSPHPSALVCETCSMEKYALDTRRCIPLSISHDVSLPPTS